MIDEFRTKFKEVSSDGSQNMGNGILIVAGNCGQPLRVYLERYETAGGRLGEETQSMLADLVAAADQVAGIARHTGRSAPDVVT